MEESSKSSEKQRERAINISFLIFGVLTEFCGHM
jgi:hypothetical protein